MASLTDIVSATQNGVTAVNNFAIQMNRLLVNIVTSIAGNVGAFTLNAASGITNNVNDIILEQATSSQFGAVKVDNTSIVATAGVLSANSTPITNSLGADVALNNTANYFDGPSVAQGTSGVWFASGTITFQESALASIRCKLWDGTTIMSSMTVTAVAGATGTASLSGFISAPVGNIRISCRDVTNTSGVMTFNTSGNSKDSTITAIRIG